MRRVFTVGLAATIVLMSTSVVANAATKAKDVAIVKAGLLTISDFPPGWAESPSSGSDTQLSGYGKTCAALQKRADAAEKLRTAHGKSPDFKQGSAMNEISNTASVYRTAAGAKAALAVLTNASVSSCLQKALRAQLSKSQGQNGVKFTSSIGRLSVPNVGDQSVGYEIAITASKSGLTFNFLVDLQLVLVGRTGLTFTFQGEGTSPMLENQSLVQTVVGRVQTAEAAIS
jgi:hypothetical protein